MKQKRAKKPAVKELSCPRCGHVLFWNSELALHHCFRCGGWFVADRIRRV